MSKSNQQRVSDYLDEHGDMTAGQLAAAFDGDINRLTIRSYLTRWRRERRDGVMPKPRAVEEPTETDNGDADEVPEGMTAVDNAYLRALEAVLDLAAENARLRRVLEAR